MKKIFEILEHQTDLKIKAFGKNLKEVFRNSMIAMVESMRPEIDFSFKKTFQRKIKIKSFDLDSLLVDFLNEILYLIQTNKEIYKKIEFLKFKKFEIEANLYGEKVKRFGLEIKAATYHDLEIKRTKDKWYAIVLFDI